MLIWWSDRGGSEIGGIHIGPTQEFASEHQLGAPQSRQDQPGDTSPATTGRKTARAKEAARLHRSPSRPPPQLFSVGSTTAANKKSKKTQRLITALLLRKLTTETKIRMYSSSTSAMAMQFSRCRRRWYGASHNYISNLTFVHFKG